MFSRGPNLHIGVVVKLIYGLIIFNQLIGSFISASSVFKSSSSSPWPSNSTPRLSRSAQQDLELSQEIATRRSDAPASQEKKILSIIKAQREPITLIEKLSRARVVRSEKFRDFQESLMERLENVRNRKQQPDQKDVYKLDINLPILSPLPAATTKTATNDNAQLDYNSGESFKFESPNENNEDDASESRKLKTIREFYPGEQPTNYISSKIKFKLRRALRDVTTGGHQSIGGSVGSEPLDFSGPVTGGGGLTNHVAPADLIKMGEPASNSNGNSPGHQQASRVAEVISNQPTPGQADSTVGGGNQPKPSNSGGNSDSVTADTIWPPERNMNHESARHRPRTSFDEFGRRNVKSAKANHPTNENGLQKNGQDENFPDIPAPELMNENLFPVAANKFQEGHSNMNSNTNLAAASGFGDGGRVGGFDRKQTLNAAESYDHTIKCAEQNAESQGEVLEENPKRIEAYEEEEYHAIPVKKVIENHHHHHHHHHHEQKKIIQKEVKKVQQQVQPVHLEIHIKGKTKGKEKKKEKSKGKAGKEKAKVKGKSKVGEEVHVKFQSGEQSQGSQEEHKKVDESSVEDNKSLIGEEESDGGGGGGQADEGKRSALADAAPIETASDNRSGSGEDSGAGGGDEEKTSGAKGESEAGAKGESETGSVGEEESSQDGATAGGGGGGDGDGKGQQQGQVDGENSGASSDDLLGHVINTSQVPNHYFDIHDHSQEGGQQSSGHEQGHQKQEEQQQEGQKQQDQKQEPQQVEEEKKAEAQVEGGGGSGEQESGQQHEHGHHQEKKHKKKAEKVQQVKQEVKKEKKELKKEKQELRKEKQEVKKEKHHQHQEPKKHKEVVEEKKIEQPVVHKQAEKHVEPVKEEPKKVVEQHKQPHKQEEQHKHKHKQKSKHQHIEVHQHKHFELHKHINLQQPEVEHEIQPHGGQMAENEGPQEENAGFEGGPLQQEHPQHLNDGYLHQNQQQLVGHGMHEQHQYQHQHQPMHGEHHGEQGYHNAMPIKEEWIAPELHQLHEKPGAIIIEDHSELERHHHQHPMEVGYNEEIIHHPHGLGLTPVAAYKLMGAYSAPNVSHSTHNNTANKSPTKDGKDKRTRTGSGASGEARGSKATPL